MIIYPLVAAIDAFYYGADYQHLITVRNEFSSARFVSVEGLPAVRLA